MFYYSKMNFSQSSFYIVSPIILSSTFRRRKLLLREHIGFALAPPPPPSLNILRRKVSDFRAAFSTFTTRRIRNFENNEETRVRLWGSGEGYKTRWSRKFTQHKTKIRTRRSTTRIIRFGAPKHIA